MTIKRPNGLTSTVILQDALEAWKRKHGLTEVTEETLRAKGLWKEETKEVTEDKTAPEQKPARKKRVKKVSS